MNCDVQGRRAFARGIRIARVIVLLGAVVGGGGCDSGPSDRAVGEARYPKAEFEAASAPTEASAGTTNRRDAMRRFGTSGQPV